MQHSESYPRDPHNRSRGRILCSHKFLGNADVAGPEIHLISCCVSSCNLASCCSIELVLSLSLCE